MTDNNYCCCDRMDIAGNCRDRILLLLKKIYGPWKVVVVIYWYIQMKYFQHHYNIFAFVNHLFWVFVTIYDIYYFYIILSY